MVSFGRTFIFIISDTLVFNVAFKIHLQFFSSFFNVFIFISGCRENITLGVMVYLWEEDAKG